MDSKPPSYVVKQLDAQVTRAVRKYNIRSLGVKERQLISSLQQNLVDARIYTSAYELSETREDQVKNSKYAKKWLEQMRKNILTLSEYNIFDPVDVAHLAAQVDKLASDIK